MSDFLKRWRHREYHSFSLSLIIYLVSKYLLSIHHVPNTMLGAGNTSVKKADKLPWHLYFNQEEYCWIKGEYWGERV